MCPQEYCKLLSSVCWIIQQVFICEVFVFALTTLLFALTSGLSVSSPVDGPQSALPRFFIFSTHGNFVWDLWVSYSVLDLVIYVYNSPWWLCFFHVADWWKISIKMYFWLDSNKSVMWCSRKLTQKVLSAHYSIFFSKALVCCRQTFFSARHTFLVIFNCLCKVIFCAKMIQRVI